MRLSPSTHPECLRPKTNTADSLAWSLSICTWSRIFASLNSVWRRNPLICWTAGEPRVFPWPATSPRRAKWEEQIWARAALSLKKVHAASDFPCIGFKHLNSTYEFVWYLILRTFANLNLLLFSPFRKTESKTFGCCEYLVRLAKWNISGTVLTECARGNENVVIN